MRKIKFKSDKEWLDFRKNKMGCSDSSIIMGVSKWKTADGRIKTPKLLWEEKLGLSNLNTDTQATRYGKLMEEPARKAYEGMKEDLYSPDCFVNDEHPNLMASLDGITLGGTKAVEIKNANAEDHELAKSGKIPDKYWSQVQMQLLVCDELIELDYFSFHKGEGVIVPIKKDIQYHLLLVDKLNEFWRFVVELKEPPLSEFDFIERDERWEAVARELDELKSARKDLEKKEKEKEEALRDLSDRKNSIKGNYMYTLSYNKGLVDYKAIPELQSVDINKYRKSPSSRWTLKYIG